MKGKPSFPFPHHIMPFFPPLKNRKRIPVTESIYPKKEKLSTEKLDFIKIKSENESIRTRPLTDSEEAEGNGQSTAERAVGRFTPVP